MQTELTYLQLLAVLAKMSDVELRQPIKVQQHRTSGKAHPAQVACYLDYHQETPESEKELFLVSRSINR